MTRRLLTGILVIITACHVTKPVERTSWPALNAPSQQRISVNTHSGASYELLSYSFSGSGLVATTGRQTGPRNSPLGLTSPTVIPYDSISVVKVSSFNKRGALFAAAIGVTAGYFIIAQTKSGERPEAVPRPDPIASCPFIYSFDGENWTLDSETYAGAIAKGLERTETDNLEHITAVDGRYMLRLTNATDEAEYTDQLSLLVAEHPEGTRVYPDAAGNLHVAGASMLKLTSRHFKPVSLPARSVWEASFRRPKGNRAALVVTVRNTEAAPFIHGEVLNTLGRDVYSWYHEVNTNPVAAGRAAEWFRTMGGLRVAALVQGEWRPETVLPVVGPVVAKTFIVPIDVDQTSETVKVRFESSPMLWQIEKIELADYLGTPARREILPREAVDENGSDVSALLSSIDGRYFVALNGSRITVEFDAGSQRPGMRLSVMARITGHYYATSSDSGRGDRMLVDRLMSEPAFSQAYFMMKYVRHSLARSD